jgi:lipoprotein-anchoring transpeptidase ErfK/SrfK
MPKKKIVVDINRQKLFAFEDDIQVVECNCITGKVGKETHPGKFRIFRMHKKYTSNKYKVPMPYAMFFTEDGKAIHATPYAELRSYAKYLGIGDPGSHGCVGVDESVAECLFFWSEIGTEVNIIGG